MLNLPLEFEKDNSKAGFRLHRLEVFNWGTFHEKVWAIEPGGQTALLTGDNRSGKSTLVDGLITLLVPYSRRGYNQASGSERRRDRDERTYIQGAYGKVKGEEGEMIRYLRPKGSYSVLLAYFYNEVYDQKITLAQVFWMQDGVKKFFVVAHDALTIQQHFSQFATPSELQKRLKAMGAEVVDEFVKYSRHFCKIFGLRSEKALDLFNQTVAIKEVGNLNDFVRAHMLEKTDAQERIKQLQQHYDNLTRAHDAIVKAQQQLTKLKPLVAEAAQFKELKRQIVELDRCAEIIPAYFAQQKITLLENARIEAEQLLARVRRRLAGIERELAEARSRRDGLMIARSNDEVGRQIEILARKIADLEGRLTSKKKQAKVYDDLARSLGFSVYTDEDTFYVVKQKGSAALPSIEAKLLKLSDSLVDYKIQVRNLTEVGAELDRELKSLKQRKSQIPDPNLQMRRRILTDLHIPEEEIPFVGELIQVKVEERAWEGAIERLLHNFGLRLLVPEKHYRNVNRYVNQTYLKGRLVFYKVSDRRISILTRKLDRDALIQKLEIKPDSEFCDWIRNELMERFDYICCENLEQFQREHKAITLNAMIKSGNALHEKDDRHPLDDRTRYILGWSNQGKVETLENQLAKQASELQAVAKAVQATKNEQGQFDTRKNQLQQLLHFDDFSEIDWKTELITQQRLQIEKRKLEESSDHLKQLEEQLAEINKSIKETEGTKTVIQKGINDLERDIQDYQKEYDKCETRLNSFPVEVVQTYAPHLASHLSETLNLANIERMEEQTRQFYNTEMEAKRKSLSELQNKIVTKMVKYKLDYAEEMLDIDPSIEAIDEFERMLETINREDLPRHRKRFKELLDEKVITAISFFKSALEKHVEEIQANIDTLNESLRTIDYTPSTIIQLICESNRQDPEIQDFRHALKMCLPDVGQPKTAATNEASFQKIKALIERFQKEERWTAKVTDVRNWLNFAASERYKEDNTEKQYYSGSSGGSGGEKAKVAYTILASAIAYQFGLEQGETRSKSFRFVVVDEAFSKSDPANTRYVMELFKKLGLQLLVVTPPKGDDIHIVESYIGSCHYVANNEEKNDSKIYNLTLEQYHEQKNQLLQSLAYDYTH